MAEPAASSSASQVAPDHLLRRPVRDHRGRRGDRHHGGQRQEGARVDRRRLRPAGAERVPRLAAGAREGQPLPPTAPAQAAGRRPVVRRQAVGPVRQPLELAEDDRRQAALRGRRARGRRAQADGRRLVRRRRQARDAGVRGPGHHRQQGRHQRHARRQADHRQPQARPAGRRHARTARARLDRQPLPAVAALDLPRRHVRAGEEERQRLRRSAPRSRSSARSPTTTRRAPSPATSSAPGAARSSSRRSAVDRNLNNVQLIPLDPAARPRARRARPSRC